MYPKIFMEYRYLPAITDGIQSVNGKENITLRLPLEFLLAAEMSQNTDEE